MKYSFYRIKRYFSSDIFLDIACLLPKRVQLWCFILVYGDDGCCPKSDYRDKYESFVAKHNLRSKGF